jgi:hypothetical protein
LLKKRLAELDAATYRFSLRVLYFSAGYERFKGIGKPDIVGRGRAAIANSALVDEFCIGIKQKDIGRFGGTEITGDI